MHDSLTTEHYYRAVREASDLDQRALRNGWIHKVGHKTIKRRLFSNIHVLCTDPLCFLYSLPHILFRQGARLPYEEMLLLHLNYGSTRFIPHTRRLKPSSNVHLAHFELVLNSV